MQPTAPNPGNLWLAKILWDSGAVQFGEFDIGTTIASPLYVNVRRIIGNPRALRRVASLIIEETQTLSGMLRAHIAPFELVAGVPMGGLHIATALSLTDDTPLIYPHPLAGHQDVYEEIEGTYVPGQCVLLVDDLITGGSSIIETADTLRSAGLMVHDAFVLLDRQAGGRDRLKADGLQLHALLSMEMLLNYLVSQRLITQAQHTDCSDYIERTRGEAY
jgi:orotate phosphoribosyltransferase/uridine monophosphate synthetase